MKKNFLQKLYDDIKNWNPVWLKDFLTKLQTIVIQILTQIGQDLIEAIKYKIIEVSKEDISGEEKFEKVFDFVRGELKITHLKTSAINLLIEGLVNLLKNDKVIS